VAATQSEPSSHETSASLALQAAFQLCFSLAVWGALLFWPAGTLLWTRGWIHLGLWTVTMLVNFIILMRMNRAILAARLKRQRFSQRWDFFLMVLGMLPAALAIPVVAGLDAVRYHMAVLPFWTLYPAVVIHAAGDALMIGAMVVNPFLVKVVRVQEEPGHHVVTTGPYAWVRHPMYSGVLLLFLAIPITLGSAYAFIPVAAVGITLVTRTVFEDRLLQNRLPGYKEYAAQVRFRLVPGLW